MLKIPDFDFENKGGAGDRVPPSRGELLEASKLSRLPSLPKRNAFNLPDFSNTPTKTAVNASCAGCGGKLDRDDNFQQSIHGCRKCIGIYARIEAAIDESSKRKRKEILERYVGGANE